MIDFLFNLFIELLKLPLILIRRILRLPGTLMLVFIFLLTGAILIIVNHFQVPGGLKHPTNSTGVKDLGLNTTGIIGVVMVIISSLLLAEVLLELVWIIVGTPIRAYKKTYNGYRIQKRRRVYRKSPRKSPRKTI